MIDRRRFVAGGIAAALLPAAAADAGGIVHLVVRDDAPGRAISPLIFGSNEIGIMDKGPPSATLDARASVTARRLGGDLMTGYNWVNNASNAGKNHKQSNGPFLLEALQVPPERWGQPAAVIESMHETSLALGAKSLITLPLSGYVAADMAGPVTENDAAPSQRFVPVQWQSQRRASDPIDPTVADIPQLLSRLVEKYGDARSTSGIHAYALDNEPGIWFQNHPRLMPQRIGIGAFIDRSIAAARVIKTIDPAAKVFGPASWGVTEMMTFQDAPDWHAFRDKGSFLAAYLDAFRKASEQDGQRLLDVLDIHWYPFHNSGGLFRTEEPALDTALLDAPRSLTEAGFREDSWVPRGFRHGHGLGLPILPSLARLTDRWFAGTELAVTEFNYGGAGQLASALALVDVLGRFADEGIAFATHWGSLDGWLNEAYRLFRQPDASGHRFEGRHTSVQVSNGPEMSAFAAMGPDALRLVLVNKSKDERAIEVTFASGKTRHPVGALGFDTTRKATTAMESFPAEESGSWRFTLPGRSARRYAFG